MGEILHEGQGAAPNGTPEMEGDEGSAWADPVHQGAVGDGCCQCDDSHDREADAYLPSRQPGHASVKECGTGEEEAASQRASTPSPTDPKTKMEQMPGQPIRGAPAASLPAASVQPMEHRFT